MLIEINGREYQGLTFVKILNEDGSIDNVPASKVACGQKMIINDHPVEVRSVVRNDLFG